MVNLSRDAKPAEGLRFARMADEGRAVRIVKDLPYVSIDCESLGVRSAGGPVSVSMVEKSQLAGTVEVLPSVNTGDESRRVGIVVEHPYASTAGKGAGVRSVRGVPYASMADKGHRAKTVEEPAFVSTVVRGLNAGIARGVPSVSTVDERRNVNIAATSASRVTSLSSRKKTPSASTAFQSPNSAPVTRRRVLLQNSTTGLRQALLKLTPDGTRPIQTQIRLRVVPSGLTSYGTYSIEW
jgi:hypothetical protein